MQPGSAACHHLHRSRKPGGFRGGGNGILREIVPDIVVFDESFVNHAVPSRLHGEQVAVRVLESAGQSHVSLHDLSAQYDFDPSLYALTGQGGPGIRGRYAEQLESALHRPIHRGDWFRRYFNPALYRLI